MSEEAIIVPLRDRASNTTTQWLFYCPGCKTLHSFTVTPWKRHVDKGSGISIEADGPVWKFNGDLTAPTFEPSLIYHKTETRPCCHVFVKAGRIEYLHDCTHALAGQTVAMIPQKDWHK